MANDDEVFKNFLIEIAERLAEFEQGLSDLEQAYKQHLTPDLIVCDHKIESSSAIEVHQQLAAIECFKSSPFMVNIVHQLPPEMKSILVSLIKRNLTVK
jgi:response regulator RpfG family c-di-GMP phosphodiesterase